MHFSCSAVSLAGGQQPRATGDVAGRNVTCDVPWLPPCTVRSNACHLGIFARRGTQRRARVAAAVVAASWLMHQCSNIHVSGACTNPAPSTPHAYRRMKGAQLDVPLLGPELSLLCLLSAKPQGTKHCLQQNQTTGMLHQPQARLPGSASGMHSLCKLLEGFCSSPDVTHHCSGHRK